MRPTDPYESPAAGEAVAGGGSGLGPMDLRAAPAEPGAHTAPFGLAGLVRAIPDPAIAIERYRHHAAGYDATTRRMEPVRVRAIRHLALRPGDTVLDVACGTGKSFALLEERIGPAGRIIGIDQSPEMLEIARARTWDARWDNVTLVEASMERASFSGPIDAVLFNYTHDVLQSPEALENLFSRVRPGARVVSAGMKLFPWWLGPLNLIALAKAYPYTTTLAGLARPWHRLEGHLEDFDVESMYCGIAYVARGRFAPYRWSA